ncbi:Crossover junction endodeoxyribonuclease RuvC [hydrothermal vent metagenome]|uniref:Crossover junction endodeoxyribonuclease RuvC n=1 Tax=hydrothermal vent metagenome TaxID=652676 RepID=A0A3B0WUX3_9ZZZZ
MLQKRRIIGIDPGSRCTGYGIIDSDGLRHNYVSSGFVKISGDELPERLGMIFDEISAIIKKWQPQTMGIEQVFMNKNADSALKLGQARGAAICAGTNANLDVGEYTPRAIKKAVVGNGAADKQQIQQMMKLLLKLDFIPQSDEADGLAIALCHATHMQIKTLGIASKVRGGRWR